MTRHVSHLWRPVRKQHFTLESIWAYLPVGPLERQIRRGYQGRCWEEVRKEPSRESYFQRWDILGKPLLIT